MQPHLRRCDYFVYQPTTYFFDLLCTLSPWLNCRRTSWPSVFTSLLDRWDLSATLCLLWWRCLAVWSLFNGLCRCDGVLQHMLFLMVLWVSAWCKSFGFMITLVKGCPIYLNPPLLPSISLTSLLDLSVTTGSYHRHVWWVWSSSEQYAEYPGTLYVFLIVNIDGLEHLRHLPQLVAIYIWTHAWYP